MKPMLPCFTILLVLISHVSVASDNLPDNYPKVSVWTPLYPSNGGSLERSMKCLPERAKTTYLRLQDNITDNEKCMIIFEAIRDIKQEIDMRWSDYSSENRLDCELTHRWFWYAVLCIYYKSDDENLKTIIISRWNESLEKESKSLASQMYSLYVLQFEEIPKEDQTFLNQKVWKMFVDSENVAFVATVTKLACLRMHDDEFEFLKKRRNEHHISGQTRNAFYQKQEYDFKKLHPNERYIGPSWLNIVRPAFVTEVELGIFPPKTGGKGG